MATRQGINMSMATRQGIYMSMATRQGIYMSMATRQGIYMSMKIAVCARRRGGARGRVKGNGRRSGAALKKIAV